jgi:hypothetical protein
MVEEAFLRRRKQLSSHCRNDSSRGPHQVWGEEEEMIPGGTLSKAEAEVGQPAGPWHPASTLQSLMATCLGPLTSWGWGTQCIEHNVFD